MALVKTNVPGYEKDERKGLVVSTDNEALAAYKRRKKFQNIVNESDQRITALETDMKEIKKMLYKIMTKVSK